METYLAIITTVLVATQIVRVAQNHLQLRNQRRVVERNLADLEKMNPTVEDFEAQAEAMRLLRDYLKQRVEE